ncbi:conjugal transfer protein TrbK [Mesorhizobium sp. WSM4312]|uniref:putative entry exclusion protein TrbK-alt n=1 Tax=unclassified Mesorhizobium TaxID=325217 RepID=UPI000BAF027A|nr:MULTISPECIES: putative entry exclusion protein TrbK-alt [unclassified Mesorhizobium]PBB24104.1 conjugal transfer protein TrbK [Mesorhizobium sp. WSM4304]PBB66040.1 conjugal transfer protein TrbK [Mesorhizobium sp. WSM4312]PBB72944.1 conjugal transfer protein TrbK [Mesorhizobium sp. WSM4308]PBC20219.1 conjugal transfer protein TrbK [Mesorhizobium sp. WSM4311]TRC75251.1 conjugal transfer protein TrbK [Mesorhizobium sp. WSM4310]
MDGKILLRLGAVVFVAAAIAAAPLEMTRDRQTPDGSGSPAPVTLAPSALREGLRHCQSLGEAALLDKDCSRLWAAQRDRFLGFRSPSAGQALGAPGSSGQGKR